MPKKRLHGESTLVKLLGFPATLIHGDSMVLDRWIWLKKRLPKTANNETLLDVGCGSGAFSIGAALRGYQSLGVSWSESAHYIAMERASICRAKARFEVLDVRHLASRQDLKAQFDVVVCTELVEHIMNDFQLFLDIAECLKPGGRLLLTTPNYLAPNLWPGDSGPFSLIEDGGHVRKGYSPQMLCELCQEAGLRVEEISYCSGILSQELTVVIQKLEKISFAVGWLVTLPFRIVPLILDHIATKLFARPHYCIGLVAYKPRFKRDRQSASQLI